MLKKTVILLYFKYFTELYFIIYLLLTFFNIHLPQIIHASLTLQFRTLFFRWLTLV